MDREVS
jgi:hypothetical protein